MAPKFDFDWKNIRLLWEAGRSAYEISKMHAMPSPQAISKRAVGEGWVRDSAAMVAERVAERVAGIDARTFSDDRVVMLDKEVDRRALIELRHREEPGRLREALYRGLGMLDDATTAGARRAVIPVVAEELRLTKIAVEVMKGIHDMERKAYRLDDAPVSHASKEDRHWTVVVVDPKNTNVNCGVTYGDVGE